MSEYQRIWDIASDGSRTQLGAMANQVWRDSPRSLLFRMARYKFVAKLLTERARVAEIGCGDGFCSRIVAQEVGHLALFDRAPRLVDEAAAYASDVKWQMPVELHDMLAGPLPCGRWDAIYCLDVIEHIAPDDEARFLGNIAGSLAPGGVFVAGAPSLEAQVYTSEWSREGHVNCKSGVAFRAGFDRCFRAVFLFGMNDEVVHTGFAPMSHYLFAVCADARR